MKYKQYTTCTKSSGFFSQHQYISLILQAIAAGGIAVLLIAAAGNPGCWPEAAMVTVAMGTLAYCHWWLEDRLVCLGGDRTAIGMLVSVEGALGKAFPGNWDTDYSINLLLAPNQIGDKQAVVESSTPYGYLIAEQTTTRDLGLAFRGEEATDKASGKSSAVLHAEFEGAGVYDFMLGSQIALGVVVFGLILCLALPGPIGWIVGAILAFLAFLAWLIGAIVGNFDGASQSDVNPALGDLHINTLGPDGVSRGADLLVVMGTWVFDIVHEGWNEIHPIKLCERIGTWNGDWPPNIQDLETRWAKAVEDATAPLTASNQQRPENQWEVHPVIDGCTPANPPPVIK